MILENPYTLLNCSCKSKMPGKTAINIGPVWSGELFEPSFLQKMITESCALPWKADIGDVLEQLLEEAICSSVKCEIEPPNESQSQDSAPKKKLRKRIEFENSIAPPFYFNLHQNRPKNSKMLKADMIVTFLRNTGFRASRTHFDREAVKTNATLDELMQIIKTGRPVVKE